ncbi:MAG: acetolactate synthase small subunit [Sphingomicrobium sp.]
MHIATEKSERHTLSVLVDNEAGILARVAGLFSARGYNIESLTVADVSSDESISRITIVTSGTEHVMEQIIAQLDRLVPVHKVTDLTTFGPHIEREMVLAKVSGVGEQRTEVMRIADIFRARVVDMTANSFVFELTGTARKIDTFLGLLSEAGLVEVARTGIVAIARGRHAA